MATGSASGFYSNLGSNTTQIAAIVDPQIKSTYFNAGGHPPQWIELKLPDLYTIHNISLQVRQAPAGETIHNLYVGSTTNPTKLINTLDGYTTDAQWINLTYSPPLTNVRFLRLHTISSPSWVAWIKFLIY